MTGWCPIHDEVASSDDGLCPRCGTALVVEERPSRPAVVIETASPVSDDGRAMREVAPATRRTPSVVWIAVALTAAFVAGLAFPDTNRNDAGPSTVAGNVSADLNVGVTRNARGLSLRLESFTQRGRNIIARVSVPSSADVPLGDLRSAFVAIRTGSGGGEIFEPMEVRVTSSGFILEGDVVPAPNVAVTALRIDTLNFAATGTDELTLDLTGAWPATASTQPRARRASGKLEPLDGFGYSVTGLIGWANRLDIGLNPRSVHGAWAYEEMWTLRSGTTQIEAIGGGGELLTFLGVPESFRRVTLGVTIGSLSISGLWEWSFV